METQAAVRTRQETSGGEEAAETQAGGGSRWCGGSGGVATQCVARRWHSGVVAPRQAGGGPGVGGCRCSGDAGGGGRRRQWSIEAGGLRQGETQVAVETQAGDPGRSEQQCSEHPGVETGRWWHPRWRRQWQAVRATRW
ncbi:hypothetical protein GPJ56_007217 [Histomonas meleagridis]|nr:hypothetical protein GPJ56_007217 [Histomonas meleagridis]